VKAQQQAPFSEDESHYVFHVWNGGNITDLVSVLGSLRGTIELISYWLPYLSKAVTVGTLLYKITKSPIVKVLAGKIQSRVTPAVNRQDYPLFVRKLSKDDDITLKQHIRPYHFQPQRSMENLQGILSHAKTNVWLVRATWSEDYNKVPLILAPLGNPDVNVHIGFAHPERLLPILAHDEIETMRKDHLERDILVKRYDRQLRRYTKFISVWEIDYLRKLSDFAATLCYVELELNRLDQHKRNRFHLHSYDKHASLRATFRDKDFVEFAWFRSGWVGQAAYGYYRLYRDDGTANETARKVQNDTINKAIDEKRMIGLTKKEEVGADLIRSMKELASNWVDSKCVGKDIIAKSEKIELIGKFSEYYTELTSGRSHTSKIKKIGETREGILRKLRQHESRLRSPSWWR